jgi:APA family basic amino acid/polyamine antiporter
MTAASRLPRILGAPSAAGVMVGLMIGSGIFRVPSSIAAAVETPGAVGLVWLAGGVLALCGALAVLELTCLYPEAGGVYVFLRCPPSCTAGRGSCSLCRRRLARFR